MNLAYLTPSISRGGGGLLDAVRRPAQVLHAEHAARVRVFGLADQHADADRALWEPLQVEVFPREGLRSFGYCSALKQAVHASGSDIVHTHGLWQYPSMLALQWARRTGRRHIVTPHGMLDEWAMRRSRWKKRLAGALFERAHLREAACVHALCESEAKSIRRAGVDSAICVVPNGVDVPTLDELGRTPDAMRAEPEERSLLYLGRIHSKKGLPALIRGWALARASAPLLFQNWSLTVAGWDQGGHEAELQRLAQELGVEDSVRFPGPLYGPAKAEALRSAAAFALPSRSEGLPMAVLEAWAYALPVLITPECNLPEGYAADAALRIEPAPEAIRQGLRTLLDMTDEQRRIIGLNGRRLVLERFSWSAVVPQLVSVYRWVLGEGPQPESVRTR